MGHKAILEIAAQTEVESPVAFRDRVLGVKRQLFHVGVTVKCEQRAALRQIEGRKDGTGIGCGLAVWATESVRKERGINDAKFVVLVQERLRIGRSYFQIVNAFHVRNV